MMPHARVDRERQRPEETARETRRPRPYDSGTVCSPVGIGERELVARAAKGDVDAFSKLVREHSDIVRRVALRVLEGQEVQDASQEVWIRVWANIKHFRGDSSFGTWLHRIAVNTCLKFRQKESRRREHESVEEVSYLPGPSGGDSDPEAEALNLERREEIRVALGGVRAEHRAALVLRHMEGMSCAEVAEILDVPDGTVKGWASRGRSAMLVELSRTSALSGRIIIRPRTSNTKESQ